MLEQLKMQCSQNIFHAGAILSLSTDDSTQVHILYSRNRHWRNPSRTLQDTATHPKHNPQHPIPCRVAIHKPTCHHAARPCPFVVRQTDWRSQQNHVLNDATLAGIVQRQETTKNAPRAERVADQRHGTMSVESLNKILRQQFPSL